MSAKAASKKSKAPPETELAKKVQKTEEVDVDDLFDDEVQGPVVVSKSAEDNAVELESPLKVPDGFALAYPPGKTNEIKAIILASSAKANHNGPTSVKLTCQTLNIKGAGADIIRSGPTTCIALTKNEKVTTETGIDVNARLIPTNMTPVLCKATGVFSVTLTLGKIMQKGLREKAVADLSPGSHAVLTDVYYNTSGMSIPWLTCTDFKSVKQLPRLDGAREAVNIAAKAGESLILSTAVNSIAFRSDKAPTPEMRPGFEAVKDLIKSTKADLASQLGKVFPAHTDPSDALKMEESEVQIPPVMIFNKTKLPTCKDSSKGVLFDDAKRAIYMKRMGDNEGLAALFDGGSVVASAFGTQRSYASTKLSGDVHVLPTVQMYIPNISLVRADAFGPKGILTVPGPKLKVPLAVLAAPFGVNERTTAELLMDNIMPNASMLFAPSKAKIFARDYEKSDYIQDVWIESPDQFTIDILTTLQNASLRISRDTTAELYDNADFSTPVPISGESLIDMISGDRKPIVSTLASGGVASLRETPTPLNDDTLEFYAVVPKMMSIAQAAGNMDCGTNEEVGDAAFIAAGGGDIKHCAIMLKKGEIAIFAVRVKAKTTSVDTTI